VRLGQCDEIGQVVALALAVDEPGRITIPRTPDALRTAVSVSARGAIAAAKASMNDCGISASGGAKTEAGSGTGWSSSKIVGLASPLVKTAKIAEPLVKMSGFPDSPRAFVITATASQSLAELSGVPSTCPMLRC
jgi:hypothetical protein